MLSSRISPPGPSASVFPMGHNRLLRTFGAPNRHGVSVAVARTSRGRPKTKGTKPMNTYMSRKQAVVQQPPLRRMLSDEYIRIYHRYALKRWRSEPTERIVRSLETGYL